MQRYRAALVWADDALLLPEANAGDTQVRTTALVSLPAQAAQDSYLVHVRYRDARPTARVEVAPFTSVVLAGDMDSIPREGADGGWEAVFQRSHLAVDQEALFRYSGGSKTIEGGVSAGATLGLRISSVLALQHKSCPTWGLSVRVQKEEHVRRAARCPPGAEALRLNAEMAINPSGWLSLGG